VTALNHHNDSSNGWESIAKEFLACPTSNVGATLVENWGKSFEARQEILDVGCGFGGTYTQGLLDRGIKVYGIDASETLIQEHSKRFPSILTKCEAAETSSFFERKFDGILSVGLIFMLSPEAQIEVLNNIAISLNEGGKFLFSSPHQICDWDDLSTGRKSLSLGRETYVNFLQQNGLLLTGEYTDEGESHYFDFQKKSIASR